MAHVINFIIPFMGEPIESARLVSWNVKPGDAFRQDDVLLEIETDKSIIEIPASEDGRMVEHLLAVDGLLDSDTPVARIEVEGEADTAVADAVPADHAADDAPGTDTRVPAGAAAASDAPGGIAAASVPAGDIPVPQVAARPDAPAAGDRLKSSPSARRLARESGLDLSRIAGSGPGGRIIQADVQTAIQSGGRAAAPAAGHPQPPRGRCKTAFHVATRQGDIHVTRWVPDAPRDVPLVVLIHGMFGDMDTWAGLISALNRAGLSVLAADLPCHGQSGSTATGLADMVQALAEAISGQSDGPVVLVGHSFGAAVATRLASQAGVNADALVLIAPVGLGTEIQQGFLDGMTHAATPEALARELRKLAVMDVALSADYLSTLQARLTRQAGPLHAICAGLSQGGVQQVDIMPDLRGLSIPMTIIHGRQDQIIPWEHALNAPPKAALHLVPQAGHMPQWDAAALVCDVVIDAAT